MTDDQLPSGTPGAWYVQFCDPPTSHWWDFISPPGFRHVLAFGYSAAAERWVIHDVTKNKTWVRAYTAQDFTAWLAAQPAGRTIVKLDIPEQPENIGFRFGFWCTIGVAHLLGIRSRALRPVALYRLLVARGAHPAFEEQPREIS